MNDDKVTNSNCHKSLNASQNRTILKSDDSFVYDGVDLSSLVSDESFLEAERQCQSIDDDRLKLDELNTAMLIDAEGPPFFNESSVFESSNFMLSSPKIEKSANRIIKSSEVHSTIDSSLSLKQSVKTFSEQSIISHSYRPSLVNVFPPRKHIRFYDTVDNSSTEPSPKVTMPDKTRSFNLIRFGGSVDESSSKESAPKRTVDGKENSMCVINRVDDLSPSNVCVDQGQNDLKLMDTTSPDQFNDTLEAVNYFIGKGKQSLDETPCSTSIQRPQIALSPRKIALTRRPLRSINNSSSKNNLERKLM